MSDYFNATGTIGFTCDNCGRELLGCTWVNGMKFCAKCYQETFGTNTKEITYVCGGNLKEHIKVIEEKDQKIADLEAKLAQSKINESFEKEKKDNAWKLIEELKQQLAEKNKEIEFVKHERDANGASYISVCKVLAKERQDKISFAVEQLNLLYKTLTTEDVWRAMKKGWWLNNGECLQLRQTIDNQIKAIKEMK